MPEKETIPSLTIAEIRITLPDRFGSYPLKLTGKTVRDIHFYADSITGFFRRRYVPGGGRETDGVFPLEQAAADLAELQHAGNASVVQVVSFITAEEYAAEEQRIAEERKAVEKADAERLKLLAAARETQNAAAAVEIKLRTPGAVLTPEERANVARVPAKAAAKPAKATETKAPKDLVNELAALAGSGTRA